MILELVIVFGNPHINQGFCDMLHSVPFRHILVVVQVFLGR
jgi:hypothetical protein